jgi:2-iminobutanoate/2-iminopropanoate deaminase
MSKRAATLLCLLACLPAPAGTAGQTRARTRGSARGRPPARRVVKTERAPRAIGPYSQAVVANGFVFCSGQIGFDPATGAMVAGGTAEQTEQVLKNLAAVLEAAGSDLSHVTKTTVFLADMDDFAAMNEVYQRHFKTDFPARSTVQVARLPRGALVEIEAVALVRKR